MTAAEIHERVIALLSDSTLAMALSEYAQMGNSVCLSNMLERALIEVATKAAADEREACTAIADQFEDQYAKQASAQLGEYRDHYLALSRVAENIADNIRARGTH